MNNNQIETNVVELFSLIGEREFIKYKLGQEIQHLNTQITEMSAEITKLKEEIKGLTRRPELVVEREKHG